MALRLLEKAPAFHSQDIQKIVERLFGYQRKKVSFHLSHVFLSEFLPQLKKVKSTEELQRLVQDFESLLQLQIESFLQERKGPPIQRPYFESVQQTLDALTFTDETYKNRRSAEHPSAMAVAIAPDSATQRRYDLEEQQLYALRRQLVDELQSNEIQVLENRSQASAPDIRAELKRQDLLPADFNGPLYVIGRPILYTSPKSPVHEGDKAFVYICRNIYIPSEDETTVPSAELVQKIQNKTYQGKLFLVFDPLYTDLKNNELSKIHENIRRDNTKVLPSEANLLLTFSRLEQEYSDQPGFSIFHQVLQQLDTKIWDKVAFQQELKTVELSRVEPQIDTIITFLTQVFLLETTLFTPQGFSPFLLANNLYFALGTGLTAITNHSEFTLERAWEAYRQATGHAFPLGSSLSELQQQALSAAQHIDDETLSRLDSSATLRQASVIRLSRATRKQFHAGMKVLPQSGTALFDLLGDTLCNGLEFGNFISTSNFNMSMSLEAMKGMPILSAEQAMALGLTREQIAMLKTGICKNPDCLAGGVPQLIHECSDICVGCWLRNMAEYKPPQMENNPLDFSTLPQNLASTFSALRPLTRFASNDILPSFFASEAITNVWEQPLGMRKLATR